MPHVSMCFRARIARALTAAQLSYDAAPSDDSSIGAWRTRGVPVDPNERTARPALIGAIFGAHEAGRPSVVRRIGSDGVPTFDDMSANMLDSTDDTGIREYLTDA